ncbi:MBG domain-containing protein [Flavobacterium nitrogenifigens]|uniref:MBG domain-containing protein n=2 Tax=Flavobacterium nitrogenifigens TaxID=1617283 RepID=UPI0031AA6F99
MKHFYSKIKKILNITLFLGIFTQSYVGNSQTTLSAGDIAFSGYNAIPGASSDTFSFVLLKDISANTVINFTDIGYSSGGWILPTSASTTEGTIIWTSSSALAAGTEVTIIGRTASVYDTGTATSSNNGTVDYNTATQISSGLSLSAGGDQIIAFQGGSGSINGPSVTLISGISYSYCSGNTTEAGWEGPTCATGPNSSMIPPGLLNGTSAFYAGNVSNPSIVTSAKFNGTGAPFPNAAAARTALMTQANWIKAITAQTLPTAYTYIATTPIINSHPSNKTICSGTNTSFSIVALNATSYQWQVNTSGSFGNISDNATYTGTNSSTLSITGATSAMNGYQYRCVATGSGSVNSNAATLTVPTVISPSIATNTPSAYGANNGTATVTASGGTPPYTYEWAPSGILSATASGLPPGNYIVTIKDSTPNGSGGCSVMYPVTIAESPGATTSVSSLSGFTTCAGSASIPQIFLLNAGQLTANLDLSPPTGYEISTTFGGPYFTNLSLTPSSGNINRTIYVRLAATATGTPTGNLVVSSIGIPTKNVVLSGTVNPLPAITSEPSSNTICIGDNTTFSITASNATGYKWQVDQGAGAGFTDISIGAPYSGVTSSTLTITGATAAMNGYAYRGIATGTGACTPAISNNAFLTINPAPAITAHPSSTSVCLGGNTAFSVTATNATGYQWQIDQGSGFGPISNNAQFSGVTTSTLTITGATAELGGYAYRVVVTGGCFPLATSANVNLTIDSPPSITAQPSSSTICQGGNTSFTATASNTTGYQWQVNDGQGGGFIDVQTNAIYSGTTTSTLTIIGATAAMNGYTYRAVASGTCTPPATSNSASLTVNSAPAITSNPSSIAICSGGNTTFSVTASNATGYKWLVDDGQGGGFVDVPNTAPYSGITASTLTITGAPAEFNGYKYKAVASGACPPSATSNTATLTVNHISIIMSKVDVACFGDTTGQATATPSGGTGNYTYLWSNGEETATITGLAAATTYTVTVTDENLCSNTANVTIGQPSAPLTLTPGTVNNTSCYGGANGTAQVIALGGTLNYTYSWNTNPIQTTATATGLSAGTYTVTVKDANQCVKTLDFPISEPPALTLTPSQNNVSCNGGSNGSATITVTGGTGAYTYNWSTGAHSTSISGLMEGIYTVTVTDENNCSDSYNFNITQPPILDATQSQTDVLCNGGATGTATVSPFGGAGDYTYAWSPSGGSAATATGLPADTYTCTITDKNGCFITKTFVIGEPSALNATTTQVDATCSTGGEATVIPSGGVGGYSYSWSPSGGIAATASGLTAGTYYCTITDGNGCSIMRSVTINTTNTLVATTGKTDVLCNGASTGSAWVVPSGAAGPFTYEWTPNVGSTDTVNNLTAGSYSVKIIAGNGCSIIKNFTITEPSAIVITPGAKTNVSCNGGHNGSASVSAIGGTGAYMYSWDTTPAQSTATATGLKAGTYIVTVTDANSCTKTQSITITEPDALVATTSQTDVSCNGGSNGTATVSVTGGTGLYTYSWSPSGGTNATASGLLAGTYTVTIKDANLCQTTASVTITDPPVLTATIAKTDILCHQANNGTATVTPSGGTGNYTYSWSPSGGTAATATGLSPNTYTVTVTDENGCFVTKSVQIIEPTVLSVSDSHTNVSCNGGNNGTASVIATGGTGAYTYSWSPSGGNAATATDLTAGTYTVTVTDENLCSTTNTIKITEPDPLTLTGTPVAVSCHNGSNGSVTVGVTGGTGAYTYSWSPSGGNAATATGLTAGTYTLTVTDANSCIKTESFIISEPDPLTATTSQTDVSCNGGSNGSATVNVTGGTGTYTYSWSPAGGNAATATGLTAGTYTVAIKDANLCETTASVTIAEPSVLTATIAKTDILCHQANNGTATVTPSGGTGNYTYSWSPSGGNAATATGLSPNTYTVTVTDENGCFITESIQIIEPDALTATLTKTNVLCNQANNGTATVTPSGGTGTYAYSWSPSGGNAATATGLSPNTYSVTITDANGCSITETVQITEPDPLMATTSQTDVSCNGGSNGSATVNVTGGTGTYTYSWSPAGGNAATATGLTAGTYTVAIKDANLCETTASVTIAEPSVLTATIAKTDILCNQANNGTATVTPSGGAGSYTYSWSPSGGNAATATGLSPNTYTVTVTDENGCFITESVQITEPTALSATDSHTNVSCNGGNNGTATVIATGGTGAYTYSWSPSGGNAATATGLTAGIYTVTVTDENLCSTSNTITVTEPDVLTLTATPTSVSCYNGNNGSATVSATGGTGTYSYSWAPSGGNAATATGLTAGTYTVTVTDSNSCTASVTVEVIQPTNPVNLNTATISGITTTGASLSGTASSDGINTDSGSCLTEVGFVYAQHANPTTADTKINVTAALGTFTNSLSGLRGNRTYYVRTYAVNSNGFINYGNEVSFTTQKYTLTVTAATGHTKVYGTTDPVFNYTALGFANGDTNSILTGLLTRDAGENVGKYNIKLGTINAGADYIINFTGAEFEITKANQTITWNQTLEFGCADSNNVALTATTDSGLPVSYTIANAALGTISGSTLNITSSGNSTITATQIGDQNHNAATAVVKPIEISQSGLVIQQWANVLFFDNKSNNFVAWQWYKNGAAISGATKQYYSEIQPLNGTYHVIAKDKNGNSIKSCPIETTGTVFSKKIKIYPNPVKPGGEFTLECDFSDSQLSGSEVVIYDITGKLVQTISNVKAKNQIIAPSQTALYIVVLKLADGQLKTINLLVK